MRVCSIAHANTAPHVHGNSLSTVAAQELRCSSIGNILSAGGVDQLAAEQEPLVGAGADVGELGVAGQPLDGETAASPTAKSEPGKACSSLWPSWGGRYSLKLKSISIEASVQARRYRPGRAAAAQGRREPASLIQGADGRMRRVIVLPAGPVRASFARRT